MSVANTPAPINRGPGRMGTQNPLGLKIYFLTAETGDPAELVARLGPRGQFSAGYSDVAELGSEMSQIKEAHHFYSVLF